MSPTFWTLLSDVIPGTGCSIFPDFFLTPPFPHHSPNAWKQPLNSRNAPAVWREHFPYVEILGTYYKHHAETRATQRLIAEATACIGQAARMTPRPKRIAVRKLTHDEVSELIQLYGDGHSTYEIARHFGINRKTVSEHLRRSGTPTRISGRRERQPA